MPRYNDRPLEWTDIIGRFEASPSSTHVYYALGYIGRLRDEGRRFWGEDSSQLKRWQRCCDALWTFLNRLSERRDVKGESLETAMREFIQEFEHSTSHMHQMLYGLSDDSDKAQDAMSLTNWFDLVFRTSTYAITSTWIDDKTEHRTTTISVSLTTGESSSDTTVTEMKVPKKYKRSTQRL